MIDEAFDNKQKHKDNDALKNYYEGYHTALQKCYELLTTATKTEKKPEKPFDPDQTFKDVTKYYLSKGKSLEDANYIAKKVVERELKKHAV